MLTPKQTCTVFISKNYNIDKLKKIMIKKKLSHRLAQQSNIIIQIKQLRIF